MTGGSTSTSGGYLADPEATFFGRSLNPSAVATAGLAAERCGVLLGEPGAGKSTVLDEHAPLLPAGVDAAVVRVDLGVYGSEDRLVREVLDAPPVRSWLDGDGEFCIVADGFDEGAARLPNLALILADRVARGPVSRLWLRIACRTADWPTSLGDSLRRLFAHATVVELLPLRRTDVAALAAGWGADGASLGEVEDANAVPFATRPLTLRLLAAGFAATGSLPGRGRDRRDIAGDREARCRSASTSRSPSPSISACSIALTPQLARRATKRHRSRRTMRPSFPTGAIREPTVQLSSGS